MGDWKERLEAFYFEREKILPNQSVGIDIDDWKEFISQELDKAREEGKLEVLEELLEWDTPLEPIGKFMRLQTKMVHMKKDLISKLTTK